MIRMDDTPETEVETPVADLPVDDTSADDAEEVADGGEDEDAEEA